MPFFFFSLPLMNENNCFEFTGTNRDDMDGDIESAGNDPADIVSLIQ